MPDMPDLHPIRLQPILKPKVWGGRRLDRYNKVLPEDEAILIGESWDLVDMPETSISGGGGGEARSMIANGPLKGSTLHDAVETWGGHLLGDELFVKLQERQESRVPNFPLLVKLLDAQDNLSVQVHPSPAYAAEHPEAHLKTESWYILEADPTTDADGVRRPARIYAGIRDGVTPDQLRAACENNTVLELMYGAEVSPNQLITLPSGTCHAMGAGVLAVEVQTPSDTTFRLWDWGRTDRALHLDEAIECVSFAPPPDPQVVPAGDQGGRLEVNDHYAVDEVTLVHHALRFTEGSCYAATIINGDAVFKSPEDAFEPVEATRGDTVLLPAGISAATEIRGTPGLRVLRFGLTGF